MSKHEDAWVVCKIEYIQDLNLAWDYLDEQDGDLRDMALVEYLLANSKEEMN